MGVRRGRRKTKVSKSKIHGHGVNATHVLKRGEVVLDNHLHRDKKFGGYNHSCDPNTILARYGHDIIVVVMRDIKRYEELTVDYDLVFRHGYFVAWNGKKYRCNCQVHRK